MFPTLFHFGHLYLPTFGVLAALGLVLALLLSEKTALLVGIDPSKLWDAGLFAVIAAFGLSRLLLLIAYWSSFRAFPILLLTVPSLTPTGLLLTVVATIAWLRYKRLPVLRALDAWAPGALLVWALLAMGHFAEGSDPGMPTAVPWGIPPMVGEAVRLHPVAIYVALAALALAWMTFGLLRRRVAAGGVAGFAMIAAGCTQFLATFLRQPGRMAWGGLEVLEWAGLVLVIVGLGLVSRTLFVDRRQ